MKLLYKNETSSSSYNTSLYCCTLPGWAIWQTERTIQHTHPQGARRNHCRHSAEYPIISGNNYSRGPSPSVRLIPKTKSMQSSQMLNLLGFKNDFWSRACLHALRTSYSVNHAALWMFPVAKKRHLSHSSANWPEWPMRTGWIITSTASVHLLHSSVRNLVIDSEQIHKYAPLI